MSDQVKQEDESKKHYNLNFSFYSSTLNLMDKLNNYKKDSKMSRAEKIKDLINLYESKKNV